MVARLTGKWNTKLSVRRLQGAETSEHIQFHKGLPQRDALCPRLLTLSLNPVTWKLKATEGYRLSKPISAKITDVLYIGDMKMYAASEGHQRHNERCRLKVEREDVCSSICQTRTVGGVG